MASVGDILVIGGRIAINSIAFILRYVFICIQYFSRSFPWASDLIATVCLIYLLYRILRRLLSMWIALVKSVVKFSVLFVLFILVAAIYIRGARTFFSRDVQFLSSVIQKLLSLHYRNEVYQEFQHAVNRGIAGPTRDWLQEPDVIIQQVNKIRGGLEGFLGENIETVQNILNAQGQAGTFGNLHNIRFN